MQEGPETLLAAEGLVRKLGEEEQTRPRWVTGL